jgi:hypothetical protein
MDDLFIKKVRTAAVAGWWTLLIATCLLLIQWLAYLLIVPRQPAWLLAFWGENISWSTISTIWFWGMAAIKIFILLMAFIVIWLTLWARKLTQID